jgi:hypothetical protein
LGGGVVSIRVGAFAITIAGDDIAIERMQQEAPTVEPKVEVRRGRAVQASSEEDDCSDECFHAKTSAARDGVAVSIYP